MEIDKKKVIGATIGGVVGTAIGLGVVTIIGSKEEKAEMCDADDEDDDLENTPITTESSDSRD